MLSLVNSSDPSRSSSRVSGFRADERDSDQLPLREEDPVVRFGEARASNFSIRDHVFALRNKSIIKSWPFPSQLLQLCLKHGIRDLLPPFEPPNSVRAHCLISSVSEAEKLIVSSSNLGETALLLNGEPSSTPTHHLCLPSNQNNLLTCSTIQAEEASTTSATSDIMASKVCPVCKAFSSTSNTTLNAHMDQCLSMESEAALAADKMAKLKVKPRKKRLMEDIYATAPSCTLEDLDRRNGSTWAVDLTAVALSAEANSEPKKTKLLQLEPRDEKTEGAVYVDSNGIKLRILSKFNDADPQVLSREELEPRRSNKSARDGKIAFLKEKKHFTSAYSKKMKLKMRNKKLSSLKLFKIEAQAEPKAVLHHEESHVEDEGPVPLSGEAEQSLNCGSVTLKNWPSSKRSDLLKKVGRKNLHKIMERPKQDNEIEMPETRRSASDTPSASKSHFGKLSKLLESITADLPSETVLNEEIQENGSLLKPSGVSSPRTSTGEEIYMGRKQKSHASTKTNGGSADQSCLVPTKTKRVSTLGGSSSGAVKFRKHRSLLAWTDRRIGELSSDGDLRRHRSVEAIVSGQGEEVANQRTDPGGSHYHDTQTRISEMQVDRNADEGTLEDADASCVIPDKTNLLMPIQENEMPMAQAPLEEEAAPDKLENGQESSACLTSNGDLRIDIPREKNSAIAMDSLAPNQETKLVSCREPSISPASSASTISPASPNHHYFKSSLLSTTQEKSIFPLLPFMEAREGIAAERNQQVDLEYSAVKKKPQHPSDSHPCCCSWQSLMAVNMPPTKPKPLPNLHIRPSISSFYSYTNSKTDAANTPSLESPTESILTRACSDVGSPSPSSGTPTPTHSSSNSILRLMGKDLMVVHNEESVQLPKVHSPATDSNSNAQASPSPLGFALPVRNQSPSMADPQARNCSPAFHRSNLNRKAYTTAKEVIIIDDSDDVFAPRDPSSRAMFQRPFSYFPPHSHLLADDNGGRLSNPAGQGSSVTAPRLPRPFAFQSPSATHLNSPFCYPQSLR